MAKMTRITIPYKPRYPEVHAALESHRFSVLVAHRRFGKTVLVINHLIKMATLCDRPRGVYAYVGPLRNQAKNVAWDYLKHYTAPLPGRVVNESELMISVPSRGNGAKVRIFGAANESSYYTDFAIKAFRTYLCMMILACVNKACFIFLQAVGKALSSTLLSMSREVVFGVGFALLLPVFFGLDGVLYSMPVSDILTFIISAIIIAKTYGELNAEGVQEA